MRKLLLLLCLTFGMLNMSSAQTKVEINGYDTEETVYYNKVNVYNSSGDKVSKFVFTYDAKYPCYNNIKVYNYSGYSGYATINVNVGGVTKVRVSIPVKSGEYTYIDDAFRDCYSSEKTLSVKIKGN